ncbi:MAG: hypothetical protein LBR00_01675 [Clostridiales Family XIII bacterium]|jgi:hypothetical protein|nr:hypothetical protein [Clostridiales Family XIII bacterium]
MTKQKMILLIVILAVAVVAVALLLFTKVLPNIGGGTEIQSGASGGSQETATDSGSGGGAIGNINTAGTGAATGDVDTASTAPLTKNDFGGEVLATVADAEITQGLVDGLTEIHLLVNDETAAGMSAEQLASFKNEVLIYYGVENELIKAHFAKEGMTGLTDEQKQEAQDELAAFYADVPTAEQTLKDAGVTQAHLDYYFEEYVYYNLFWNEVIAASPVTDAEVQAYYDEYKEFYVEESEDEDAEPVQIALDAVREEIVTDLEDEKVYNALEALRTEIGVTYLVPTDPETGEPPLLEEELSDEDGELEIELEEE